jgi:hypothetical protein
MAGWKPNWNLSDFRKGYGASRLERDLKQNLTFKKRKQHIYAG